MGIDHRGLHILMPQQLLHGTDIIASLQQMGSKGMAQGVRGYIFGQPCINRSLLNSTLQPLFIQVMPTGYTGTGINR